MLESNLPEHSYSTSFILILYMRYAKSTTKSRFLLFNLSTDILYYCAIDNMSIAKIFLCIYQGLFKHPGRHKRTHQRFHHRF